MCWIKAERNTSTAKSTSGLVMHIGGTMRKVWENRKTEPQIIRESNMAWRKCTEPRIPTLFLWHFLHFSHISSPSRSHLQDLFFVSFVHLLIFLLLLLKYWVPLYIQLLPSPKWPPCLCVEPNWLALFFWWTKTQNLHLHSSASIHTQNQCHKPSFHQNNPISDSIIPTLFTPNPSLLIPSLSSGLSPHSDLFLLFLPILEHIVDWTVLSPALSFCLHFHLYAALTMWPSLSLTRALIELLSSSSHGWEVLRKSQSMPDWHH